jgi:hypothetical protein
VHEGLRTREKKDPHTLRESWKLVQPEKQKEMMTLLRFERKTFRRLRCYWNLTRYRCAIGPDNFMNFISLVNSYTRVLFCILMSLGLHHAKGGLFSPSPARLSRNVRKRLLRTLFRTRHRGLILQRDQVLHREQILCLPKGCILMGLLILVGYAVHLIACG